METRARRVLLSSLTGVFLFQTWLVYSDPAGRTTPPLTPRATAGQRVWHRHNCQSCHQLYGFGGFLGPDLTNLATRLAGGATAPEEIMEALTRRFETVLTLGSERMPAFHLDVDDRLAVATFLFEIDRTGVGQAQVRQVRAPRQLFDELLDAHLPPEILTEEEARGRGIVLEKGCIDCHLPNAKSTFRATDLARIRETVEPSRVSAVLADGIPQKGMPDLGLTDEEIESVAAFLDRLPAVGGELRAEFERAERSATGSLLDLPWFEYP